MVNRAAERSTSLNGEAVSVLGYGNLGRTAALNLRDSKVKVRVGNREDEYADLARADALAPGGSVSSRTTSPATRRRC